jgi:membrane protein implicated in regulation of membrane protease activity
VTALLGGWLTDPAIWAAGAVALMLLELLIPGFVMLGLGAGALAMAGLVWVWPGMVEALTVLGTVLLWAALSLVSAWAIAKRYGRRGRQAPAEDVNDFTNH